MELKNRKNKKKKLDGKNPKNDENDVADKVVQYLCKHRYTLSISIRLLAAIITQTYFVPDEYWQSTEVAHRNVFGYGYITWEWKEQIRSYLYPFIFELYFGCLKITQLDFKIFIVKGPHIIQALISSIADISLFDFTFKYFKCKQTATYTFLLNLTSWFVFYTCSRTLSNTAAMCFISLGLSYFPLNWMTDDPHYIDKYYTPRRNSLTLCLLYGGISCILRPPSLIIWCLLMVSYLYENHRHWKGLIWSILNVFPVLFLLLFGIDYYYYGVFTFTHWNFLQINIFHNINIFYGAHPVNWYFTQGLPVVYATHLVFIIIGVIYNSYKRLFYVAVVYVIVLSFIPHKEFRFLLPIFPLLLPYAGYGVTKLFSKLSEKWKMFTITALLFLNVLLASYFCTIHQGGVVRIINHLSTTADNESSVLFIMPCHSTPYYSYLHRNIPMRFLTCHPSNDKYYVEEAEIFYNNPLKWLSKEVEQHTYSHVVMFNTFNMSLQNHLLQYGFLKKQSFFHSHFPEGRIGSHVFLFEKIS